MLERGYAVAVREGLGVRPEHKQLGISSISGRPFTVTQGDLELRVLCVWSHSEEGSYVNGVHSILSQCATWLNGAPSVVLGDFNAHPNFDIEHPASPFASVSDKLFADFGMVSAYHTVASTPHGTEHSPTFYHQWNEAQPFHIDYCFVPMSWAPSITGVTVGSYAEFEGFSDHRPIVVDIAGDIDTFGPLRN